jgi:hypothetical protein
MLSKNVAASVAALLFVVALQRPTSRGSNEIESGKRLIDILGAIAYWSTKGRRKGYRG